MSNYHGYLTLLFETFFSNGERGWEGLVATAHPKGRFTHTMPFPYCAHAVSLSRPCHYLAILRQCRTRAGRPHAVSERPMLIHTYHAVSLPRTYLGLERSLAERHIRGMACERLGICESDTATLCKSNGKDTI
jgi:hypothetical protein